MGNAGIGADLLYMGENGLTVLSPYYQNGLYLFGWGQWNDSVTVAFPYPDGNDGLLSAVGQVHYQVNPKMKAFANAGYVTTMANNDPGVGLELNAGIEMDLYRIRLRWLCLELLVIRRRYRQRSQRSLPAWHHTQAEF
jgi:hypothetical protein